MGNVIRLTEGPLDMVACFNRRKTTRPLVGICTLSRALNEATKAFMAVLDDLRLADIAPDRREILPRITPMQEGILWQSRRAR